MVNQTAPSPSRAPDPRPARTRAAIISAIERLSERGEELSVSLVVAEAGLSRSSFYSQFNDIGDVAVQLLREHYAHTTAAEIHDPATVNFAAATAFLLTEFDRRRYLYAAVLGSSADVTAEWEARQIIAQAWLPIIIAKAPPQLQPGFAAEYIASGHLASVIAWLRSEHPAPQAEVEAQLIGLLPGWA